MREKLNKEPGECVWGAGPTSTKILPCEFPPVVNEGDGIFSVTLPTGHRLYRSEKHKAGSEKWFERTAISETGKDHYWFANTIPHVQVFGGSHVLTYEVIAPIRLLFIQNLYLLKGFKDGYAYWNSRKFQTEVVERGFDGYVGCNECEILLIPSGLEKLRQMPIHVEDISRFISGGSRKVRKTTNTRGRGRRRNTRRAKTTRPA